MHAYHPGQYLTLRVQKKSYYHNRHYSLTQPFDGKTYCIAIKQEIDRQSEGLVSNEIINKYKKGDEILASLPAGTFTLIDNAEHHLFIAGGIGITVLACMIRELNKQRKANLTTLFHCVPTESHAAFTRQMRRILPQNQYHILLRGKGRLQGLIRKTIKPKTHVYVCGSVSFMDKVQDYLAKCEHPSAQIHTEAFRPTLSLIKNAVKDQSNTKSL
jgi:nitric oxide dioxygenase